MVAVAVVAEAAATATHFLLAVMAVKERPLNS